VDIGDHAGENLRNACCEVTSADNNDICNLGSINMGRMHRASDFHEAVECGTAFLLCGTLYGKLPFPEMYKVREQNRRIGLGLMGVHEWLLRRGMPYAPNDELAAWMYEYQKSGEFAARYADRLGVSRPVATRSIAPTGTISIVAETTSGIEPIYAVAYKRRYLEGVQWKAQYVIDPAAKRLIDSGVDPALMEDSYTLAEDVDRRVAFQAWLQGHVDHAISSTINLPPWGSSLNNESTVTQFGRRLMQHLPRLRGITAYPDGARGGQPLNRVNYTEAVAHVGKDFIEEADQEYSNAGSCKNGVCGE
jgi:ribonucleoside-diphosphate reductase alpha chain